MSSVITAKKAAERVDNAINSASLIDIDRRDPNQHSTKIIVHLSHIGSISVAMKTTDGRIVRFARVIGISGEHSSVWGKYRISYTMKQRSLAIFANEAGMVLSLGAPMSLILVSEDILTSVVLFVNIKASCGTDAGKTYHLFDAEYILAEMRFMSHPPVKEFYELRERCEKAVSYHKKQKEATDRYDPSPKLPYSSTSDEIEKTLQKIEENKLKKAERVERVEAAQTSATPIQDTTTEITETKRVRKTITVIKSPATCSHLGDLITTPHNVASQPHSATPISKPSDYAPKFGVTDKPLPRLFVAPSEKPEESQTDERRSAIISNKIPRCPVIPPAAMIPVFPNTHQAQPSTIQAQPSTIQAQPSTIQAQPSTIQAQPSTIQAQPSSIREQLTDQAQSNDRVTSSVIVPVSPTQKKNRSPKSTTSPNTRAASAKRRLSDLSPPKDQTTMSENQVVASENQVVAVDSSSIPPKKRKYNKRNKEASTTEKIELNPAPVDVPAQEKEVIPAKDVETVENDDVNAVIIVDSIASDEKTQDVIETPIPPASDEKAQAIEIPTNTQEPAREMTQQEKRALIRRIASCRELLITEKCIAMELVYSDSKYADMMNIEPQNGESYAEVLRTVIEFIKCNKK